MPWEEPRRFRVPDIRRWQLIAPRAADQLNDIVENMKRTAPGVAGTAGGFIVTRGRHIVAQSTPAFDWISTSETTTSTSYTNLTTTGPTVDVLTGTAALVFIRCQMDNTNAGAVSSMSIEVTGKTATSANDNFALRYEASNAADQLAAGVMIPFGTGTAAGALTAGINTFTAKYKVSAGTGAFQRREITVIPL